MEGIPDDFLKSSVAVPESFDKFLQISPAIALDQKFRNQKSLKQIFAIGIREAVKVEVATIREEFVLEQVPVPIEAAKRHIL